MVRSKGARTEIRRAEETGWRTVSGDALTVARSFLPTLPAEPVSGLPPFQGGLAGYIGYDWGAVLERLPPARLTIWPFPTWCWRYTTGSLHGTTGSGTAWLVSTGLPESGAAGTRRARERLEWLESGWGEARRRGRGADGQSGREGSAADAGRPPRGPAAPPIRSTGIDGASEIGLRSTFTHRGYLDAVARVRDTSWQVTSFRPTSPSGSRVR